jgi:anthranilate synthase component 1
MPIAGTRPRGNSIEHDQQLEKELVNSEKEMAEHAMLVDLGRNDIGMICQAGTVKVADYARVNRFSRVMHLVSRVQGEIKQNLDAIHVLQSAFPAGTLTGAPKIRAMEIIDEIEHSRRGVYGGAICAIDHEGQLDSCITIRTALIKNNMAIVRAGGGVVMDSEPRDEIEESRRKAQCVFDAIALAERGFV